MSTTFLSPSLLPAAEEAPSPEITTLLHPRNRRSRLPAAWEPPPGWEEAGTIEKVGALEDDTMYPSLRAGIILRELGGFLVIHDPVTLDIHKLNLAAATIFLLANGQRGLGEIAETYARRFALGLWKAIEDVEGVVRDLVEKNVIVPRRERIRP